MTTRPRALGPRWLGAGWLVAAAIAAVVAIAALEYRDESARSEAALGELGDEQLASARAAALALDIAFRGHPDAKVDELLAPLVQPGTETVLVAPPAGALVALDGTPAPAALAEAAAAARDGVLRISRADSETLAALGLPERTAMAGIAAPHAGGWTVAVVTTASRQRDRDREGRTRTLLAIALAAAVVTMFAAFAWRRARALAVAEAARARDAELERLSRAATMAALGSGVAHELSTPLGVIVGRAEQLAARAPDERAAKAAQAILDQAAAIDRVVRGLLGLARGAPIALEDAQPEAVVADTVALVAHRFERAGVELHRSVADRVPAIRAEPALLRHALVNLLLNACDASPAGGRVELAVTADAEHVTFTVTDDGAGIPPDMIARAVEPFYTTKPAGKGTGLGLAIASEIAKTHRGTLALAPREPRGTRATITLPIG
nr:HAMP domain-containing sensor histidine kinase [Kofleriaceae bacterium]